ncbi:MAG: hypothetical protein K2G70_01050 [Turicibacter sp.]|nr:hypothetical protein [Turicibacter sp.]
MNKNLLSIGTKLTKVVGRGGLVLRKHSPEILLAAGIVGFVGTVVLASNATLKAPEILDEYEKTKADIEKLEELIEEDPDSVEYTLEEAKWENTILRLQTIGKYVKLYAPAAALGAVSVACLITSRNITHKRYLAAVSAYNALSGVFNTYRKRVVDEYGEKLDRHFRYGTTYETVTETDVDENGKKVKKKVDVENTPKMPSDTARYFDSSNPNWDQNANYSMMFLRAQQNYLNDLLHRRGHVFLNEVYDALGFKHTPEGAAIGWLDGVGDGYIDIGLYDSHEENVRRFVNGDENCILLDFNHEGVIWDKI